jgi:alanine racemase
MESYNRLTISLEAIQRNLSAILSRLAKNTRIMPMVKAHGYGTDEIILTQFLQRHCGISIVGVSHVEEGVALRKKGCSASIFVISAPPFEAERIAAYNLEVAIETVEQCLAFNQVSCAMEKKIKVHVHLNTGMQRLGCSLKGALELGDTIQSLPGLILEGVMTHFVAAESEDFDSYTAEQMIQKLWGSIVVKKEKQSAIIEVTK